MSLRLNGVDISVLKLNGVTIDKAYLNGTEVYSSFGTHDLTVGVDVTNYGYYSGVMGDLSPLTVGGYTIERMYAAYSGYYFYVRFTTTVPSSATITVTFENDLVFSIAGNNTVQVYESSRSDIYNYLVSEVGNTVPIEITIT